MKKNKPKIKIKLIFLEEIWNTSLELIIISTRSSDARLLETRSMIRVLDNKSHLTVNKSKSSKDAIKVPIYSSKRIQNIIFQALEHSEYSNSRIQLHRDTSKFWNVTILVVQWILESGTIFMITWESIRKRDHSFVHIKSNWNVI